MLFSVEKCKVLHMGHNNPHVDYLMDGVQLQKVSDEKDLGLIVSEDLKWEKQCSAAVQKGAGGVWVISELRTANWRTGKTQTFSANFCCKL